MNQPKYKQHMGRIIPRKEQEPPKKAEASRVKRKNERAPIVVNEPALTADGL